MKNMRFLMPLGFAVLMVLAICAYSAGQENAGTKKRVTADFRDTDVKSAIQILFDGTGLTYTIEPGVDGEVTLKLENASFQDALRALLKSADNLKLRMKENIYVFAPAHELPKPAPTPHKKVRTDVFSPENGPIVRVGLENSIGDTDSLTISCGSGFDVVNSSDEVMTTIPGDQEATFSMKNGKIQIKGETGPALTADTIIRMVATRNTGIFNIIAPSAKCRRYQGILEVRIADQSLTVIDELSLEDYVRGVVPFEVSQSFRPEAQKALTVAIRTYALKNLQPGRHAKEGFNVCDGTDCQGFAGSVKNCDWVNKVVDATHGQIITYDGKPISAVYSTDCGGVTQNNEDAGFGSVPWPYLRSVVDNPSPQPKSTDPQTEESTIQNPISKDYCAESPYHDWAQKFTSDTLDRAFSKPLGSKIGKFQSMEFSESDSSGRVKAILVKGDIGETKITGSRLRALLGGGILRSTRMTLTASEDGTYLVQGHGYGHGVGLCAYGANGMAASDGVTYQDILKHYYSGVQIQTLNGNTVPQTVASHTTPQAHTPNPSKPKPTPTSSLVLNSRVAVEDGH